MMVCLHNNEYDDSGSDNDVMVCLHNNEYDDSGSDMTTYYSAIRLPDMYVGRLLALLLSFIYWTFAQTDGTAATHQMYTRAQIWSYTSQLQCTDITHLIQDVDRPTTIALPRLCNQQD